MPSSSVCVTGMAWSTALGSTVDGVWKLLLDGASGLRDMGSQHPLRNTTAAIVPEVSTELEPWTRQLELTKSTLAKAVSDAGLSIDDPRVRPVLGTSYGPHLEEPDTHSLSQWSTTAARDVGCVNSPVTVTTACSAGADAMVAGAALLTSEAADICVCGGVDVLTIGKRLGHSQLGTMSATDLRAFDIDGDGTLLGEGAAFLVLETAQSVSARGARVYAVLAGTGSANDASSAVAPDRTGLQVQRAVRRALDAAGIGTGDIAVINAHGSGTPVNDEVEATAYSGLFSDSARPPAVFATKGAFGHTLGATGAIEAIAVIQALRTGIVPPVHALSEPIPALALPVATGSPMNVRSGYGISVTLGFGGFDTCLVFQAGGSDRE